MRPNIDDVTEMFQTSGTYIRRDYTPQNRVLYSLRNLPGLQ